MKLLDSISDSTEINLGKLWEKVRDRQDLACCSPLGHRVKQDLVAKQQQCVCVDLNHFAICLKLTQNCKLTILQLKKGLRHSQAFQARTLSSPPCIDTQYLSQALTTSYQT